MKQYLWVSIMILTLLLSACGSTSAALPTTNAVDVQNTAIAAAFTVVSQTQAVIPTKTVPPPTGTASPTPLPTDTPLPSPTVDPLAVSPTIVPTFTSQPASSAPTSDPCNQPLTSWKGPSASFTIDPEYSPQGKDDKIVISLWVMTASGECGYLMDPSVGPAGQYSAAAFVDGKKDFKVFGGFRITEGSWKLVIRNDSILAFGVCYPNC